MIWLSFIEKGSSIHTNADSLSRIPSTVPVCDCYFAGCNVHDLPCGGCNFCTKIHNQWARFEDDVDDVIPLAARDIIVKHPLSTITRWHNTTEKSGQSINPMPQKSTAMSPGEVKCHNDRNHPRGPCNPSVRRLLDEDNTSLFVRYRHNQ